MALKINPNLPFVRHYDKLIAVVVLIVLLISLFYLTSAGAARKQEEANYIKRLEDLKPKAANLAAIDLAPYEAAVRLAKAPLQLDKPDMQQAGFLAPERRVACVAAACQKPIPFAAEACPFCGTKQPSTKPAADLDSDNDGIADRIENALGLNPNDPADAKGDLDSDGFNNLEELLANTDPKDPKAHPALVSLLRVKELRGKRLPFIFTAVLKMPDGYKMTFNQIVPKQQTFWVREGEKIGESGYVAGKLTLKSEERQNPNMPKMRVDVSTVVVKRLSDNKEVTLTINEGGKNTDVEAVIVLPLDNAEYAVLENGTFKVRDETFRVLSINSEKTSVVIESEASGLQKVVPKLD